MAVATRTFRDFFAKTFKEDRAYREFNPKHFRLYFEMAHRFHRMTTPANFDEDDIEFLSQFPHEYWVKAKQARYQMLFDAVHKLHRDRQEIHGHDALKQTIIKAMQTGEWSHLQGVLSERDIAWLQRHAHTLNDREKEEDAEKLAHDYVKTKTPHIDEPTGNEDGEVAFTLSRPSDPKASRGPTTFMAKPFLNRLYHKLETTPGHPHHEDSGLEGEGKYGFDMADPMPARTVTTQDEDGDEKEVHIPPSTAGMKFPTPAQIRDRLTDFYNINSHRILGDLPEDAEWKPVPGFQDTWSANYVRDEIQKRIEAQLRVSGKKYGHENELRKEAADKAKEVVIQMAKAGQLKGPPIPGLFPEGIPIKAEGPEGAERLINPPLYLPYTKKPVKIKDPDSGVVRTVQRDIPIVNPAHFFRELGSSAEDYEHDEDGKRQYDPETGEPIFKVPPEKLRGYEKKFVHVGDEEFVKKQHKAAGAIDFNSDSEKEMHMTKGDPDYPKKWQQIFGDQEKVVFDGKKTVPTTGTGFYKDIIDGIKQCFSSRCGGATAHELEILRNNIEDFHQIVVVKMLQRMADPQLLTPEGRRKFSYSKVSSIMQKDQGKGGGSRRERALTQSARDVSFSGGGAEKDISGELEGQLKGRDRETGGVNPIFAAAKKGRGKRHRDTSGLNTPYNLGNMREALQQMERDARDADSTSGEAKKLSQRDAGIEIVKMLRDGINKQVDFKLHLTDMLAGLYGENMPAGEAKQAAQAQVKSWMTEDGHSSAEALLGAFQKHPLVTAAIGQSGDPSAVQPAEKGNNNEQEAIRFLQASLDRMRELGMDEELIKDKLLAKPGEKYSAFVRELVAQHFGGLKDEKLLVRVQGEIDRRLGLPEPSTAKAAREIKPAPTADVDLSAQRKRMQEIRAKSKLGGAKPADAPAVDALADKPEDKTPPPALAPKPVAAQTVPIPTAHPTELEKSKDYVGLAHSPLFLRSAPVTRLPKLLTWVHANKDKMAPHEYDSSVASLTKAIAQRGG